MIIIKNDLNYYFGKPGQFILPNTNRLFKHTHTHTYKRYLRTKNSLPGLNVSFIGKKSINFF